MLFNTWSFCIFLLIVFTIYYLLSSLKAIKLPRISELQVLLLTLASFFFYGYSHPKLIILLVSSVLVNGFGAWLLINNSEKKLRLIILCFSVIFNIIILFIFKYSNLIYLMMFPNSEESKFYKDYISTIVLPIGISFYTFQGISLVIDIWRKDIHSLKSNYLKNGSFVFQKNIWFYISFFPQLIAGPIVKAKDFLPQICTKNYKSINWRLVASTLIIGFFLKMVVADNLKEYTILLSAGDVSLLSKIDLLILLYGYSFQIYADFCGYSSIAIGLAALFGYKLKINFNFPYIADSFADFWHRWHISLSSWLKEYLYFPLGGNKKGAFRTYVNLFIVMGLGGLWHGAAWSYAIWGIAHGGFLALERFLVNNGFLRFFFRSNHIFFKLIKIFLIFHLVSLLWLLFCMPDFNNVILYFKSLAQNSWMPNRRTFFAIVFFSSPVILHHIWGFIKTYRSDISNKILSKKYSWLYAMVLIILLFLIIFNSGSPGEFIYFQF